MAQPEKEIQAQVVHLLRSLRWDVWSIGTRRRKGEHQGTMMTPGIPDIYAQPPEVRADVRELWVEAKAPGGRLRDSQIHFQACCLRNGVPHIVGGTDEVIDWLILHGYLSSDQVSHERKSSHA